MTPAKKSFRLELTKEQQALVLQNTGMKGNELELTDKCVEDANRAQAANQP